MATRITAQRASGSRQEQGDDHRARVDASATTAGHTGGVSSGIGAPTVRALADAGHTEHAGIRDTEGRNKQAVAYAAEYAAGHGVTGE